MTPTIFVNDEIINAYLSVFLEVPKEVKICSSNMLNKNEGQSIEVELARVFFNKYSLEQFHKVFIPLNISDEHWVLIVIDFISKQIRYRDSLKKNTYSMPERVRTLSRELEKRTGHKWPIHAIYGGQIRGSNDCGMFLGKFIEEEIDGSYTNYDETRETVKVDMAYYRSKMFLTIMKNLDFVPHFSAVKDRPDKDRPIVDFNIKIAGYDQKIKVDTTQLHLADTNLAATKEQPVHIVEIAYENILSCTILPSMQAGLVKYFIIRFKNRFQSHESLVKNKIMVFTLDTPGEYKSVLNISGDEIAQYNFAKEPCFLSDTKILQCNNSALALGFCIHMFSKKAVPLCSEYDEREKCLCKLDEKIGSFYMMVSDAIFLTDSCFSVLEYNILKRISFDVLKGCNIIF